MVVSSEECPMAALASELVHGGAQDPEAVQAGIEFECWLAESCRDVLDV
jgi:hypothetical protein